MMITWHRLLLVMPLQRAVEYGLEQRADNPEIRNTAVPAKHGAVDRQARTFMYRLLEAHNPCIFVHGPRKLLPKPQSKYLTVYVSFVLP